MELFLMKRCPGLLIANDFQKPTISCVKYTGLKKILTRESKITIGESYVLFHFNYCDANQSFSQ